MATNYDQPGETITFANASAVSPGACIAIGAIVGVALGNFADNQPGSYRIEGVFELPKAGATGALAVGARAFVAGGEVFSAAATGRAYAGIVTEAAGSSATTCKVKLNVGNSA